MSENKSYIDLANRTINVLYKISELPCASKFDLRSLAKNLCNFQDRWASPIDLPYEMGKDMTEKIEIERPTEALSKLHCIYEYKDEEGNTKSCLAGSDEWKKLVSKNELKGEDAKEPNENFAMWIVDLFELFKAVTEEKNEQLISEIRPLAACWYYHSSETSFEDSEEASAGAPNIPSAEAIIQSLLLGKIQNIGDQNNHDDDEEDEDEDYDEEDEDEEEGEEEEGDDEDEDEDDDEEEEEEEEEEIKEEDKSIERANGFKEEGNSYFKQGDWEGAIGFYSLAINYCPSDASFADQRAIFYANRAAALLNLEKWKKVIEDCTVAIENSPKYTKALSRRAKAYESLEKYEEALADHEKILELEPGSQESILAKSRLRTVIYDEGGINSQVMEKILSNLMTQVAQKDALSNNNKEIEEEKESSKEKEVREKILQSVNALKAYFPIDDIHFNRMYMKVKSGSSPKWFPHGCSPSSFQTILDHSDQYDDSLVNYAKSAISKFKSI